MADITPMIRADAQVIQSYIPGQFKISGKYIKGPVLVFPRQALSWDVKSEANSLQPADFEPIFAHAGEVDVVLLGCGDRMRMVPQPVKQAAWQRSMMIEPMDTGAACRTYNVMLAEGRRVIAAMLPVGGHNSQ